MALLFSMTPTFNASQFRSAASGWLSSHLETPKGLRRDASVYVEGHSKKTVTSDGREYRLVAAVRELEALSEPNQEPKIASVTLEWVIYFLTEEDWKNRPRGPFIVD